MGIGSENLVKVKTDERGRMCTKDLEACVEQTIKEVSILIFYLFIYLFGWLVLRHVNLYWVILC